MIEPYLMQQGFVQRTPRGRMLTETAFRHLDLPVPASLPGQLDLLAPLAAAEDCRDLLHTACVLRDGASLAPQDEASPDGIVNVPS